MRIITTLTTILLTASTATSSQPQLLTDAQTLNRARSDRVAAEIALQKTIVVAKETLHKDGFAAPLEVDVARLKFAELVAIRSAITAYQGFVNDLARECSDDSIAVPADTILIAVTAADPTASTRLFQCDDCEQLRDFSSQIATARRSAIGRLQALQAAASFLEQFIGRLRHVGDGSVVGMREIGFARLRLNVVQSRIAMGEARQRYDATREELFRDENCAGFPIELADRTIDDAVELASALETAWQDHLTRARTEAAIARQALHSKYRSRLAASNHGPLRHGALTHSVVFSAGATGELQSVARLRQQRKQLDRLADNDEVFANELQRVELELDIALARESLARQFQRREQLAERIGSSVGRTTVHTVSTSGDSVNAAEALTGLFEYETKSRAERELANGRVALLHWKLTRLRPLLEFGHATWKEVAIAERDLAIARAQQRAADEQQRIVELQLRRARLITERSVRSGVRAVPLTALNPSQQSPERPRRPVTGNG